MPIMASASIILSTSTKKLAPTTILPLLHNTPNHKLRSPVTPRCHKLSSLAMQLDAESTACRSIHETLSTIHNMGRVVLGPDQVWTPAKKGRKSMSGTSSSKKRNSSTKASDKGELTEASLQQAIEEATWPTDQIPEPSEPPLESALKKMQPRHREVVGLAMNTEFTAEEIGVAMRPEKPLSEITVASYLLLGLESATTWREEDALYNAIGKERIINIVKADYWRWKHANGYGAFCKNEDRVKAFTQNDKDRKKLKKELEKGKIGPMVFEMKMQEIQQGWKFHKGPRTLPKGIVMHLTKKGSVTFFKRNQDLDKPEAKGEE